MKQLTDEQIEEMARQEQLLLVCDDLEALTEIVRATERALAALDSAQPVQVNAMLVEDVNSEIVKRYKVEKTKGGFWPYCVKAGDGTMDLFIGSKRHAGHFQQALQSACLDGAFMALTAAQQAQPALAKLSKFKLLAITTAYEQGVGKGKERTDFNPYSDGTDEREAWRLGYQEGEGMGKQAQPKKPLKIEFTKEWCEAAAKLEEASDCDFTVGHAQQAQPERAPLSEAELEQEFCKITGLETGINPAAADTKRALVWFKKGYAHGIKQGGRQ